MPARTFAIIMTAALLMGATACAPVASNPDQGRSGNQAANQENAPPAANETVETTPSQTATRLPLRYQRPAYLLPEEGLALALEPEVEALQVPVGADMVSAAGPVPLRDILRRMAGLKQMTVSWASDVDKQALVDVDIRAEDDFFEALDHLLQQRDYYHQVEGNVIQVKYRETRRFHVPIPFMNASYRTGVGGEVQGSGSLFDPGATPWPSNINQLISNNDFDIWDNIRQNLDQLLGIWEETVTLPTAREPEAADDPKADDAKKEKKTTTRRDVASAKGYYTIDNSVGVITVTAPRLLVQQIEEYLDNLKFHLFQQITIEAKIIEVVLDKEHTSGIDWRRVLSNKRLDFEVFGSQGIIYPNTARAISQVSIGSVDPLVPFRLLLDAIEEQGETNVLSNPRISIMNGQPALINVGDTTRYISSITPNFESGVLVGYDMVTDTVMSGLSMSVLPIIVDKDSIVLSLTPVTTELKQMGEERFGSAMVQLPQMDIREMQTMVRVRNGDTLMIGGLIDETDSLESVKVPLLGDIPGLGKLFRHDTRQKKKRELVILLQPTIL